MSRLLPGLLLATMACASRSAPNPSSGPAAAPMMPPKPGGSATAPIPPSVAVSAPPPGAGLGTCLTDLRADAAQRASAEPGGDGSPVPAERLDDRSLPD